MRRHRLEVFAVSPYRRGSNHTARSWCGRGTVCLCCVRDLQSGSRRGSTAAPANPAMTDRAAAQTGTHIFFVSSSDEDEAEDGPQPRRRLRRARSSRPRDGTPPKKKPPLGRAQRPRRIFDAHSEDARTDAKSQPRRRLRRAQNSPPRDGPSGSKESPPVKRRALKKRRRRADDFADIEAEHVGPCKGDEWESDGADAYESEGLDDAPVEADDAGRSLRILQELAEMERDVAIARRVAAVYDARELARSQ